MLAAMTKAILSAVVVVSTIATVAAADPAARRKPARLDLASMNLTPTKDVVRRIPTRDFQRDVTPTSFHYALPASGMGAVVGYKPYVDTHPIQGYEVNEATAIGFSQPSSSVGAALAYRF